MDKINQILNRGVTNIVPNRGSLEKILRSGKKLNIYYGIDPTNAKIHIGYAVHLRKMQQLVEDGHNVFLLVGDYTALVGDTSDKEAERPILSYEQIQENLKTYKQQAAKVLDFSKIKLVYNGEWLSKLEFKTVLQLCQHFSLNDFVSRELIRRRLDKGSRVRLDEIIYPIMQGYDSFHLDTDVQLGAPDQIFNMQAGRTLIKDFKNKESFILVNDYLMGIDNKKMSKTSGNAIWIEDPPEEMFGKIMSLRDELINQYFVLATNLPLDEIPKDGHPMELKKQLAHQIVTELHNKDLADAAQKKFEDTFQKGEINDAVEIKAATVEDLICNEVIESKSEWKRLVKEGAVERDGEKISEINSLKPGVYKIGKKRFIKVV